MTDHLILTVDYEVFGDGQGCVQRCVVEPTERVLRVAEAHQTPVTLFVDATEFAAMERCGFPIPAVRDQLRGAVDRGHAVALHIHPQWAEARRDGEGWTVGTAHRIGDRPDAAALLDAGLDWLTTVLGPDWTCSAFRAGGWAIQPSASVVALLAARGIVVDSSVTPGRHLSGDAWFDFRTAPARTWWTTDGDVCRPSPGAVYEVPVATARIGPAADARALLRRGTRHPEGCTRTTSRRPSLATVAARARALGCVLLDFCAHDAEQLLETTASWRQIGAGPRPVVAVGHSKNATAASLANLETYLRRVALRPSTYAAWLEALHA